MKDQDSKLLWEAYDSRLDNKHHQDEVQKLKRENPQLPLMRAKAKMDMGIKLTDNDKKALKAHGVNEGTDGSTDDLTEREKFKLAAAAAKKGKGPLADKPKPPVKNEDNHDDIDEFGSAHYVLYKYDPASKDIKPVKKYRDMSDSELDQLSNMLADLTAEHDGLPRDETFPFVEDERVHDYFEHYMPDGMDVAQVIAIDEDYNLVKLVPDPGDPV